MSKTVIVLYPVYVQVSESDTVESILDASQELISVSTVMPIIQTQDGTEIYTDEDLREFLESDS